MKKRGAAPCTAMSLTQWFTRSPPTVECRSISKAIFSLVPTPSTLETRTGSAYFVLSTANSPPNPPISLRTPRVNVLCARYLMRCLVRLARLMSTPASAYVIEVELAVGVLGTTLPGVTDVRDSVLIPKRQPKAAHCSTFEGVDLWSSFCRLLPRASASIHPRDLAADTYTAYHGRARSLATAAQDLVRDEVREEVG